jgi:hypothetical protein
MDILARLVVLIPGPGPRKDTTMKILVIIMVAVVVVGCSSPMEEHHFAGPPVDCNIDTGSGPVSGVECPYCGLSIEGHSEYACQMYGGRAHPPQEDE